MIRLDADSITEDIFKEFMQPTTTKPSLKDRYPCLMSILQQPPKKIESWKTSHKQASTMAMASPFAAAVPHHSGAMPQYEAATDFQAQMPQWQEMPAKPECTSYPTQNLPDIQSLMKEECTYDTMSSGLLAAANEEKMLDLVAYESFANPIEQTFFDTYNLQGNSFALATTSGFSEYPAAAYTNVNPTIVEATPFNFYEVYQSPMIQPMQQHVFVESVGLAPVYPTTTNHSPTPPPQDPRINNKPKKRTPAVPCHVNSVCANCHTKETTLWRRNSIGEIECNACNLYYRKNQRKRPISLRKDGIMKRNRKPRREESPIMRVAMADKLNF